MLDVKGNGPTPIENRNLFVVKLERVEEKAKEAEDIEAFRKIFEEYK